MKKTFREKVFTKWFDDFGNELFQNKYWYEIFHYKGINLYDAIYGTFYLELLNEFRRQIDQENIFSIHGFNYLYDRSIIERIIYFLERISYRIKIKIPSKMKNISNYRDSVLIIRSARNPQSFERLTHIPF